MAELISASFMASKKNMIGCQKVLLDKTGKFYPLDVFVMQTGKRSPTAATFQIRLEGEKNPFMRPTDILQRLNLFFHIFFYLLINK